MTARGVSGPPAPSLKILAADTSTASGSVALLEDDRVKAEWTLESTGTHNRRLLKTVDDLLALARREIGEIDAFAVTSGPGSFTGVRIGLTTFKTFAWSLGKPLLLIPTLDALAAPFGFSTRRVCPLVDARKKEVYAAFYRGDGRGVCRGESDYLVTVPELLAERTREKTLFVGDGWKIYGKVLKELLGDFAEGAPATFQSVRASVVAELARRRLLAGESDDAVSAAPLYVRPSEAEINYPHLSGHLKES